MSVFVVGITIFILIYILIATEKIHKTIAALLGACLMLIFHVLTQEEGFKAIDLNVILLLVSMMIIVHIVAKTGVFSWVAIKVAQISKGEPLVMLILLCVITAVISAFLDNVTTIILVAPVIFLLTDELKINPVPFLIMLAIASNIGGTATLIGDPPNIMIGSAANLNFNDFLFNLFPVVAINIVVFVITAFFMFRKSFVVSSELKARIKGMHANKAITDKKLLTISLIVLAILLFLFLTYSKFGFGVATVALAGAVVLMLFSKTEPEEVFHNVEWSTLFFFIGLFIMVEGLIRIGFISLIGDYAVNLTNGNRTIATISMLWISGIASAIIDNIPYTATMIPIVKHLGANMSTSLGVAPEVILNPLWWALSLGACLGGNGTLIGASANVIVAGLAKKNGHNISFFAFFKYGIIFMLQSMILSSIYLYFVYLK